MNRGPADFSGCIGFSEDTSTVSRSGQSELSGDISGIAISYIKFGTTSSYVGQVFLGYARCNLAGVVVDGIELVYGVLQLAGVDVDVEHL